MDLPKILTAATSSRLRLEDKKTFVVERLRRQTGDYAPDMEVELGLPPSANADEVVAGDANSLTRHFIRYTGHLLHLAHERHSAASLASVSVTTRLPYAAGGLLNLRTLDFERTWGSLAGLQQLSDLETEG